MGEITEKTEKEKAPKQKGRLETWWKGLKSEFKKIVWPSKDRIVKESAVAIVVSIVLSVVIALVDMAIEAGLHIFI